MDPKAAVPAASGPAFHRSEPHVTQPHGPRRRLDPASVRRFRLTVVEGPLPGAVWESGADRCSLGSHPLNDVVLDDETVSRFHCEVRIGQDGARVRDLDSLNGVVVDGVQVLEGFLRGGSVLRLGRVTVRFDFSPERNRLPLSESTRFGSLVGASAAMRACFARMERAAAADVTVLLGGETGTGKSQAAQAIHQASARRDKPFLTWHSGSFLIFSTTTASSTQPTRPAEDAPRRCRTRQACSPRPLSSSRCAAHDTAAGHEARMEYGTTEGLTRWTTIRATSARGGELMSATIPIDHWRISTSCDRRKVHCCSRCSKVSDWSRRKSTKVTCRSPRLR